VLVPGLTLRQDLRWAGAGVQFLQVQAQRIIHLLVANVLVGHRSTPGGSGAELAVTGRCSVIESSVCAEGIGAS